MIRITDHMKWIGSNAFCWIILRIIFLLHQTIHNPQNNPRSAKMTRDPQKWSSICNIIIITKLIIWSEALRIILKMVRITDHGSQLKKWSRLQITDNGSENYSDRGSRIIFEAKKWSADHFSLDRTHSWNEQLTIMNFSSGPLKFVIGLSDFHSILSVTHWSFCDFLLSPEGRY